MGSLAANERKSMFREKILFKMLFTKGSDHRVPVIRATYKLMTIREIVREITGSQRQHEFVIHKAM